MAFAIDLIDYVRTNFTNQNDALDYVISEIIVAQIDDSELDDCTKGVLNELKDLQQNDIAKIIRKLNEGIDDDKKHNYITKINKVPSIPFTPNFIGIAMGYSEWKKDSNNLPISFNYKISLRNSLIDNGTNLGIASTLIHELIHVYFLSLIDDCHYKSSCSQLEEYNYVWNYYVQSNATGGVSQHEQMAVSYVNIIASVLQEFHTGIPVPPGTNPNQLYIDLAWGGLFETDTFSNNSTLSDIDKQRIRARYNSEHFGDLGYNNEGVHITSPIGTPCN
ncbi:hypothetical protein M0M57_10625 [Flavobacterium azooxidireducens]|uniref:SprT-like domain-containing protein n=1 Tax=Flavobacterium azooxidireducens TaxID=1871076 RepID=A0ABY4KBA5_9FLAO|nr:hypothetical protein [Flavobacterium azooxidireducens]UPQ78076.1 hypothetical protein M0M57_10625 [Flavobacterium azooxidireducens]